MLTLASASTLAAPPSPLLRSPVAAEGQAQSCGSSPLSLSGEHSIKTGGPYKKNSAKKSETHFENGSPCVEIFTKKSEVILVSAEDAERVLGHTWYVNKDGYAQTMVERRPVLMHRMLCGTPKGLETDHRDRNKLNNTRSNLRVATKGENGANRQKSARSKNRFKGVRWSKFINRWFAECVKNGVEHQSRACRSEEEAARAYDELAKKHHGEFAWLNFPGTQKNEN